MKYSQISQTKLHVSKIGLGTVKLGRNKGVKYPNKFTIPNDRDALELLHTAADLGINLIDTAPAYGNSEERLGTLLPQVYSDWILCTKAGEEFNPATGLSSYNFTPEFLRKSIESSLKKLKRENLEIVLIHSDGNDIDIIKKYGALELLQTLKDEGKIIASGMSTKTVEGGLLAIDQSDIAMVTHNLEYQDEESVINYAEKNQKSIFIKKAFASGHLAQNSNKDIIQESFDFLLNTPGITSAIIGTANTKHLKENTLKALHSLKTV